MYIYYTKIIDYVHWYVYMVLLFNNIRVHHIFFANTLEHSWISAFNTYLFFLSWTNFHIDIFFLKKMIKIYSANICLVDSATMHTILKIKIYFSHMVIEEESANIIIGDWRLQKNYYFVSWRNLLSFKDIHKRATILFPEETYWVLKIFAKMDFILRWRVRK